MSRVPTTRWATPPAELRAATAHLDPPFGVLDEAALRANAAELVARAGGKPIRLATKSVRIRELIRHIAGSDPGTPGPAGTPLSPGFAGPAGTSLVPGTPGPADTGSGPGTPGFAGLLCYTLPEALWLHRHGHDDIVVGYPTAHRSAIAELAADESAAAAITLMVDDPAQLDLIDRTCPPDRRPVLRICLELDAAFEPAPGVHLGAWRSPVRTPCQAAALAAAVNGRNGFTLVGMMAYEGQVAGIGDAGATPRSRAIRAMRRRSVAELADRRSAAVQAVRQIADLEFVNGGGTGSLESTAAEDAVTEVAAGSGLLGPGIFDHYTAFHPAAASFFVLPVVRKPRRGIVTLGGGGWIASGPPGPDRLPVIADPPGLRYLGTEAAGEVQTPVRGRAARKLVVGEQVWLRHGKAGEPAEHLAEVHLVSGGRVREVWPTYRGEGQHFG